MIHPTVACAHQNEPNCYVFITGVPAEVIEELAAIKLPVNVLISVDMQVNNLYGELLKVCMIMYYSLLICAVCKLLNAI